MKKFLFVFVIAVFVIACGDDDPIHSVDPDISVGKMLPLAIGNYWGYTHEDYVEEGPLLYFGVGAYGKQYTLDEKGRKTIKNIYSIPGPRYQTDDGMEIIHNFWVSYQDGEYIFYFPTSNDSDLFLLTPWLRFYDDVERNLAAGHEYEDGMLKLQPGFWGKTQYLKEDIGVVKQIEEWENEDSSYEEVEYELVEHLIKR